MNPGSDLAVESGCTCQVLDNARGVGIGDGQFWISEDCPLHGRLALLQVQEDRDVG